MSVLFEKERLLAQLTQQNAGHEFRGTGGLVLWHGSGDKIEFDEPVTEYDVLHAVDVLIDKEIAREEEDDRPAGRED